MTDKEMLLFVLNRAKDKGIIGHFFDANNETTDEIHNTWKAYQREAEISEEKRILDKARKKYESTYYYRELMKSHNLEDCGLWTVFGEDPNCDLGGRHHKPFLGNFEGKLDDVINKAVEMSGFWQWGAGGDIKPMAPAQKIIKI